MGILSVLLVCIVATIGSIAVDRKFFRKGDE